MPLIPKRDARGVVIAHDDLAILPESKLVRHINPEEHICLDENTGRRRIKSSAFSPTNRDPEYGMSVDLEQLLSEAGLPIDDQVPKGFGAVAMSVASIRSLALRVGSDPEAGNPFHGQIWGVKTKTLRQRISGILDKWVTPLEGVDLKYTQFTS